MSTARLTALGTYTTFLAWMVWRGGLPLERFVVLGWLVGFAIIAIGGRGQAIANRAIRDWVPFALAMLAYDVSRGAADSLGLPVHVSLPIHVDRALFLGQVPTVWLQRHLGPFRGDVQWWELAVSVVYVSHFIVPFAVGVWLWARHRDRWVWWRDRFLTLTALGLATYVLLPTAPPWLAARQGHLPPVARTAGRGWNLVGLGIADRVLDLGRAAVNLTAALPSLHAAFAVFTAVALWRTARRPLRVLLVVYPLAMGATLVVSGEHYVFDVLVGWAYVAATVVLWRRFGGRVAVWRARHADPDTGTEGVRGSAGAVDPSVLPPPPTEAPARGIPASVRLLAAGTAAFAALTRAISLGHPDVFVFDEGFYATQALEIAQHGVEQGHTVHPPLAKWAIALGIRIVGFTPVGWRLVPLLAGAGVVACAVVAGYRATGSRLLAGVGGAIVATDGVALVTGRLALLDGVVALFASIAFVGLMTMASRPLDVASVRRWCWPVAVALGAAMASKWSAAPVWLVAIGFVLWLLRRAGAPAVRSVAVLVVVPLVVYALVFVPTVIGYRGSAIARSACANGVTCGTSPIDAVRGIVDDHVEVLRFHTELEPTNRYAVSGWNWVVQSRPTVLYHLGERTMTLRGNPVLWAGGAAALVWCGWFALRRRTPVHTLLAWLALAWWAPWAIGDRPGYSFYAAPLVPVLATGVVTALAALPRRTRGAALGVLSAVVVVGAAVLVPQWYAR